MSSDGWKQRSKHARSHGPAREVESERLGKRPRHDMDTEDAGTAAGSAADASGSTPSASNKISSDTIAAKCRTSTLFVGGLHPRVADVHLQKLFQPYGTITRIFQVKHKEGSLIGQPKGYAFVEFLTVDSARSAIKRIDGRMLLGRTLHVRPAHNKTEGGATPDENAGAGGSGGSKPTDTRSLRKEKSEVESKIEAVKRAIEEKRRRGLSSRR
uniref:RRM domain-containing protein n=1 Tax=Odontella aurita TaxID=265563 RepID=A0A7S4N508_9STRA|mmetsp:Transcript_48039/g.145083  ORF Transcript_48039/g.145083 Transcript_48039/m.145083 type:complete len:213 (+) Transcript_48039:92-730(+)|eukprot:CAMPEP_0113593452 /NCGR_PEP_ID=MMETSP0015_2-20120614/38447_1 /TAXON_ID=2838 /ORGANISM="Odontella" /LENGTH=212 /DNA_ID=CAMNT_0000500175 /DNA_START=21 /DNA_END=659 /DNA_ORIENTATION=- /assembly_acc=CAM_ASM_000160